MKVHGKNLFPLERVFTNLKDGYFMDANGDVYSSRTMRGFLSRMHGTVASRFSRPNDKYFTFQTKNYGRSVRHLLSDLRGVVMARKDFESETKDFISFEEIGADKEKVMKKPKTSNENRSHAATTESGIKAHGSIIGRLHKGRLVFGSAPSIHTTSESVEAEMLRLATAHPGVKFIELKIGRSVIAGSVQWD